MTGKTKGSEPKKRVDSILDPRLPLQHQLHLQILSELSDGLWVGQVAFPTEKELSERFKVSLITARATLDRLEAEGWIRRTRGKRSTLLKHPTQQEVFSDSPLIPIGKGAPYRYEIIFADTNVAPAEACRAFGIAEGSNLWQCSRLRLLDGEPHSVTHNAQRPEVGARHSRQALKNLPMATILEEMGMPLSYFSRRISAVASPPFVAEHLNITLGTPTLLYTCTLHGQDRSLIEWIRIYLRPGVSPPPETFNLKERARLYQSGL